MTIRRNYESLAYEMTMAMLIVLCVLFAAALYWQAHKVKLKEDREKTEKIERIILADVCWKRWQSNSYQPSRDEIAEWMDWIRLNDNMNLGALFYVALIDVESSGDPTARGDGGTSRGLGSIKQELVNDYLEMMDRRIKRKDVALYNPHFNIEVMAWNVQRLCGYYEGKETDIFKWALLAYNSGLNKSEKWRKNKTKLRFTFYRKVCKRRDEIQILIDKRKGELR